MAKTSMSQRKTMGRVMHEYAHGELRAARASSGGGGKVKSRRQAIAIALEEAGASKYESKEKNRRNLARSKAKEATGRTAQQETEGKARVGARGKRESSRAMGGQNAERRHQRRARRRGARRAGAARGGPRDEQAATHRQHRRARPAGRRQRQGLAGQARQRWPLLGLKKLGCSLTVVPPGKRAWRFHRHHVMDELFYIVSGSGEVRLDDRTLPVRAGDLIANPAGAEAHQIINTGASELRYLAISDIETVDIIEYPDPDKVGMAAGVRGGNLSSASYKAMGRVTPADYFDGEKDDWKAKASLRTSTYFQCDRNRQAMARLAELVVPFPEVGGGTPCLPEEF